MKSGRCWKNKNIHPFVITTDNKINIIKMSEISANQIHTYVFTIALWIRIMYILT